MATEVGIANTALRRIGATRITSFTEGSKSADCVNEFYAETRDDLLRSHNWNFATERVKLAQLTTAPAFGFEFAYGLPADWIRTVSIHDNDAGVGTIEFKEEFQDGQNVILADASDVYLRYIGKVTDPNRMPADFRTTLSRHLAAAMSVDLSKSNTIRSECEGEAAKTLRRAKSTDAMGASPERRPVGTWAGARNGGNRR
jgi:hypothetical protein